MSRTKVARNNASNKGRKEPDSIKNHDRFDELDHSLPPLPKDRSVTFEDVEAIASKILHSPANERVMRELDKL